MADSKITALTSIGTSTDPVLDQMVIVDVSDGSMAATGTTKKVTLNQLLGAGGTATLASATITGAANFNGGALAGYLNGNLMFGSSGNIVNFFAQSSGFAFKENTGANNLLTISNAGVFGFLDGAGGTRMTLNSTGLGVGVSPAYKIHANAECLFNGVLIGTNGDSINGTTGLLVLRTSGSERMRIDSSGNVGVGVTPSANGEKLNIAGTIVTTGNSIGSFAVNQGGIDYSTSTKQLRVFGGTSDATGSSILFITGASGTVTERMRIDSAGNVGVGGTPSAWNNTYNVIDIGQNGSISGRTSTNNQVDIVSNGYRNSGGTWVYKLAASSPASRYLIDGVTGSHSWYNGAAGTAGNTIAGFSTASMTLDASGRLILLASTTTPATLSTNGQLTMTATSDTNLRFSYRGSDGVTRVANITLA